MSLRVGIVCPQEELRLTAAKAFDSAPADWDISLSKRRIEDADVVVTVGPGLPGAIPMDLSDPGSVIGRIRDRVNRTRRLIVVVGASGGSGATSIALHLAAATRSSTAAVVDLHPGAAAARLGISADQLPDVDDEEPVVVPVRGGFRIAFDPRADADRDHLLDKASGLAETVIIDSPTTALASMQARACRVVVVMTPTVPSATKAAELMRERQDLPWVPITNRTGPGSETTRSDIERILGRRLAIELPCSPGLRDAEDDLELLTSPFSPWRMRIQRLSDAL